MFSCPNSISTLFFAGWYEEVYVTSPEPVRPKSYDGEGGSRSYTLEISLRQCHPAANGR